MYDVHNILGRAESLPYTTCTKKNWQRLDTYFRRFALGQTQRHTHIHIQTCSLQYSAPLRHQCRCKNGKGSPYWIAERRFSELIPVLGSQLAGDVSHKPGGRLSLLSARLAITLATLKTAATSLAAWWTEARRVWTVCLRLLPDSVAAAVWTQALLRPSPAR